MAVYICGLVIDVVVMNEAVPRKRQVGVLRSSPASPLVRAVQYGSCVASESFVQTAYMWDFLKIADLERTVDGCLTDGNTCGSADCGFAIR